MGTRVKISQILKNLDIKNSRNSSSSSKNKSFNGKVQFFDKEGSSDQILLKGSVCQPSCLMDKAFISLFDDQELKISEGHFYGSLECISKIASRYKLQGCLAWQYSILGTRQFRGVTGAKKSWLLKGRHLVVI